MNHAVGRLGVFGALAATPVVANRAQTNNSPSLVMKLVWHRVGLLATELLVLRIMALG
jgi:hypothetical protein